jgi:phosphoketolase
MDYPDLNSVVMVGDSEAETGPLATAWHSNKFLNPIRDGAILPILHLNGYKINNPPFWPVSATKNSRIFSRATAIGPIFWRAQTTAACTKHQRLSSEPNVAHNSHTRDCEVQDSLQFCRGATDQEVRDQISKWISGPG